MIGVKEMFVIAAMLYVGESVLEEIEKLIYKRK